MIRINLLVLICKGKIESLVNPMYSVWRNDGLSTVPKSFGVQSPMVISKIKLFITRDPKR